MNVSLDQIELKWRDQENRQDRYHRQSLIDWWDQKRVREARALVIGAGALGNEILKLLSLMGIGHVLIFDMDVIEESNLSRTILFRKEDEGKFKAQVAAEYIQDLNPDVRVEYCNENIIERAGLGVFLWADIVICGLDNRLARIFVNQSCARTDRSWVDGAIEGLSGIVRVFNPSKSVCYECTMGEVDHQLVHQRRSCSMLARDVVERGHVPTTVVSASIVGALQVQEALKILHGQPTIEGEGILVNGRWAEFDKVRYQRKEDCPGHENYGDIIPLGVGIGDNTLDQLLSLAEEKLGEGASLDLSRDVVTHFECMYCDQVEPCGKVLGFVGEADAHCPVCNQIRSIDFIASISRNSGLDLGLTLQDIGIPPFDIVVARQGVDRKEAWLFDGDAEQMLGALSDTFKSNLFNSKV